MITDRQPFGVLIEHRIDHVYEGFIRREKAVATGKQIALEHAFHGVLAEHFDNASVRRQFCSITVLGETFSDPEFLRDLVNRVKLVGRVLVWREDSKAVHIPLHDIAQKTSQWWDVLYFGISWAVDLDGIIAELGQSQFFPELCARVRTGAHAALPFRRKCGNLRSHPPAFVEEFFRLERSQPGLK